MSSISKRVLLLAMVAVLTSMQWGCSRGPHRTPQQALEERAKQYWDARQSGDRLTVYKLEAAARPGGWLQPNHMVALGGLPVKNVRIKAVQVEGEKGQVTVAARVMVGDLGWVAQESPDPWVHIDGEWYHETYRPTSLAVPYNKWLEKQKAAAAGAKK
jgi:hypothetical protein